MLLLIGCWTRSVSISTFHGLLQKHKVLKTSIFSQRYLFSTVFLEGNTIPVVKLFERERVKLIRFG